jgi:RND family efflux transporter MFP subunit
LHFQSLKQHFYHHNMKHLSHHTLIFTASLLLVALSACNVGGRGNDADNAVQPLPAAPPAEVTTVPLIITDFEHEIVSNGRISARMVAEVKFQTSEIITEIFVRNGDRVTRGQRLATLDTFALNNRVEQARDALERARLDMQNVLIGQGFRLDSLDAVPNDIMQLARTRSGFNTAQINYDMAKHELERATLVAPISGTVANLFANPLTLSRPGEVFCHIIDTQNLEVSFTVLENELGYIQNGDNVRITPFSMPDLQVDGRVSEINPWVNENGMVQVKASVSHHPRLIEGMNVRVSAFRSAGQQWVVPKSAVVLRTGRQVLFTAVGDRAFWHYIETGLENATQITVTGETLHEGDQIIVSGNINLAHESPIRLVENIDLDD